MKKMQTERPKLRQEICG